MGYTQEQREQDQEAHRFLCHADGSECEDGCDRPADPKRLAEYESKYGPANWWPCDWCGKLTESGDWCGEEGKRAFYRANDDI